MTVQHPEMPDPVSAVHGSPHYSPWAYAIRVKLDGEVVKDCVAASAKMGWVEVQLKDLSGKLVTKGEHYVTVTRHGLVELSWITPGEHGAPRAPTPNDKPESPAT